MSVEIFVANDGIHGNELWATSGSSGQPVLLKDIRLGSNDSNPSNLLYSGSYVYFTAYDGADTLLWRTDGTTAGTLALTTPGNGGSGGTLTRVGGTLFYNGNDSTHGSGLFAVDG